MVTRLLPAPVDPPPRPEANPERTALVPATRPELASRTIPPPRTVYPDDSYVWSVSPGDDGSFLFYALPLDHSLQEANSSDTQSRKHQLLLSPYVLGCTWDALHLRNAVAQYMFCATMAMPMFRHSIDLYL